MSKSKDTSEEWEVTGGGLVTNGYMAGVLLTGGLGVAVPPTKEYPVKNPETGEKGTVLAGSKEEAQRKAREGDVKKKKG